MIVFVAFLIVLAVSAFVIVPLLGEPSPADAPSAAGGDELWTREKDVAILAITEADFDRATGKLSDDDYRILRSDYEGRALTAMDEIEKKTARAPGASDESIRYCAGCGAMFSSVDAFCGSCGRRRFAA